MHKAKLAQRTCCEKVVSMTWTIWTFNSPRGLAQRTCAQTLAQNIAHCTEKLAQRTCVEQLAERKLHSHVAHNSHTELAQRNLRRKPWAAS